MTLFEAFFGTKQEADLKKLFPILNKINSNENWARGLNQEQFLEATINFKQRLKDGESLDDILPEAFALAREAARRILGERLYDAQLLGSIVLHQGRITEMKTGEGKTLSSVPAAYLNSLTGLGVHVVTVNDYLAERDANWMKPVFSYLGVSVDFVISTLEPENRRNAYSADITYATNNELGFDYLRDNMRSDLDMSGKLQQNHSYCIIDEIDSILIDEARTPLIISGAADEDTRKYPETRRIVKDLVECTKDPKTGDYPEEPVGDFKIDEKGKRIMFTDAGINKVEEVLLRNHTITGTIYDPDNFEYLHLANNAVKAQYLYKLDKEYVVKDGQVQIVDEFTGRVLHGRRYSDGLHQAIEAKENIKVAQRNRTLATITFQNFFRMYKKISGMTGTAETEAKEFGKIYGLDVVVIPTNRPVARRDEDDLIYLNESDKFEAICDEIQEAFKRGQPVLVGTVSIEKSEKLSLALQRRGVKHEVLNAKNHAREATIVAEAGAKGSITIATNMAGRGTDIKLGGNLEHRARKRAGSDAKGEVLLAAIDQERSSYLKDYEEICSLEGLYIIGTERHESRRIDNQLRGRSGRQGDPGRSKFFLSLDDELMRLFGGNLKSMLSRLGMQEGEALNHPWLNKAIERAQRKVEDRNFDIRKHLLEFDDVLNEQRKYVYDQRDAIINDLSPEIRILQTLEDFIDFEFTEYDKANGRDQIAFDKAINNLKLTLYINPDFDLSSLYGKQIAEIKEELLDYYRTDFAKKAQQVGEGNLKNFLKYDYLRTIDARWQDHLENLEALREAVYLRSYAQKNPLLEYKLEGFQVFDEMLVEIRTQVARRILNLKIETNVPQAQAASQRVVQTRHQEIQAFGNNGQAQRANQAPTPAVRTLPKVGRNDLCPCGSGKKYKHCHGQ